MRKYLLLAAAATVVATPAVARDRSTYVGIEAGGMIVEDTGLDYEDAVDSFDDAFVLNHKTGLDVGLIGGYDFGAVRGEVELAYKRASIDQVEMEGFPGGGQGVYLESDGRTRVISGMVNALIDIGDDNGWSGYFGPGVGLAFLKHRASVVDPELGGTGVFGLAAEDRGFAWQLIAGVRRAITPNMDVGVKYRMFTTRFEHSEADGAGVGNPPFTLDGRFRSHSLLASLIYNFAPPPPPPPVYAPPPPPPPPPATQTCPDGSVVLATDPCPLPPPPPPPPPPLPERG